MSDLLLDRIDRLCGTAALLVGDHALSAKVTELRTRLREPLRVAVAGRVKAGKSTLLNALVGERLAPTDAGECTRVITWYKKAAGYEVTAVLRDGSERALRFLRTDSSLAMALDGLEPSDLERIVVGWPSSRLDDLTLIDTPGLEGHDDQSSMRTLRFLGLEDEGSSDVDAVIYLMRHMHRSDAGFLEAFMDRSLSQPSSVNAVAVLSRADEIGAGRLDALVSARAIARRYREDERVRTLCSTVIPVAGLIAETGATLREDEAESLRSLAAMPADALAGLLLSVDRFCAPALSPLPSQTRQDLLDRFGLFGVRFALDRIAHGDAETASALSRALIGASGIEQLADLLNDHFAGRARLLKARSVLVALKDVARRLGRDEPIAGRDLLVAVEEFEATTHELAELRLWHLAISGTVDLDAEDVAEIRRMTSAGDPTDRLGLPPDTQTSIVRETTQRRIEYWRARATHPLTARDVTEVCDILARSYEGLYAETAASP